MIKQESNLENIFLIDLQKWLVKILKKDFK